MNNILQDLTATSLTAAIENNVFACMSAFSKWPRVEFHDEATMIWSISDIPFPLFNSILRAQLVPDEIDATIQSIIAQANLHNVPLLWWTGPATQPADLGKHLEKYGFRGGGQMPGMAVNLANLNENLPMPAGLTIQRVEDPETLKSWCQIFAAGFGMPDFVADAFYDYMYYVNPDSMLAYLGRLNDQPVATSLLALAAGVAGIYNVATLPPHEGKGLGQL